MLKPAPVASSVPAFEVPGGWTEREFVVSGRTFRLTLPADPDAFLDDPRVHEAHARTGYMPYWGHVWPSALDTATAILEHDWPPGLSALEIGAGTGVTGLAALAAGLNVTFSDYDPQSVALCLHNARRNGFEAEGLVLDWRDPPDRQFAVIIGCDVVYEKPNHAPVLGVLRTMLAPGGEAWIADPGRHQAEVFVAAAREAGFELRTVQVQATTLWKLKSRH